MSELLSEIDRFLASLPAYAVTLARVAAILAGAFVVDRISRRVVLRFEGRLGGPPQTPLTARQKRAKTLASVLAAFAAAIVWVVAALTVLDQVGINVAPLIAAAGVGGLAIGFGAQNLVRDVIAGFFILLENQYDVGDVVEVAGVSGKVEQINLRTTILRDLAGRRHVVPNGEIKISSNYTKDLSRYSFTLEVPAGRDAQRAAQVARSVAEEMKLEEAYRGLMSGPLELFAIDPGEDASVAVTLYLDTAFGKHWLVGGELVRRIGPALEAEGITVRQVRPG